MWMSTVGLTGDGVVLVGGAVDPPVGGDEAVVVARPLLQEGDGVGDPPGLCRLGADGLITEEEEVARLSILAPPQLHLPQGRPHGHHGYRSRS